MCIFCEQLMRNEGHLSTDGWTHTDNLYPLDAEACAALRRRRKRVTVVTGFLGSGKTSFLNYVLSSTAHKKKIGVIVNEFGETPIDDTLLRGRGEAAGSAASSSSSGGSSRAEFCEETGMSVVSLENGCVCCTVRGDLIKAMLRFRDLPDVDYVLLECSGLSEVVPVCQSFFEPSVQASFQLDGVVCIVDGKRYLREFLRGVGGEQASSAGAAGSGRGSAPEDHAPLQEDELCCDTIIEAEEVETGAAGTDEDHQNFFRFPRSIAPAGAAPAQVQQQPPRQADGAAHEGDADDSPEYSFVRVEDVEMLSLSSPSSDTDNELVLVKNATEDQIAADKKAPRGSRRGRQAQDGRRKVEMDFVADHLGGQWTIAEAEDAFSPPAPPSHHTGGGQHGPGPRPAAPSGSTSTSSGGTYHAASRAADAEQRRALLVEQLSLSDVVLVNKIDLLSSFDRRRVVQHIRERNGVLDVLPCRNSRVNIAQVLDRDLFTPTAEFLGRQPQHIFRGAERMFRSGGSSLPIWATVHSVSLAISDEPLDTVKLRAFLADLYLKYAAARLLRCKGIVLAQDSPLQTPYWITVQGVADHVEWEVTPADIAENLAESFFSRFVVIFQSPQTVDFPKIHEAFEKCRVSSAKKEREGKTPAQRMLAEAR